ncbi:hypothetical protein ZWY2020_045920 [Hordeum vulgare]|nr:hypothetical protein ZWY2020_045920 [Hordeum vulgare]
MGDDVTCSSSPPFASPPPPLHHSRKERRGWNGWWGEIGGGRSQTAIHSERGERGREQGQDLRAQIAYQSLSPPPLEGLDQSKGRKEEEAGLETLFPIPPSSLPQSPPSFDPSLARRQQAARRRRDEKRSLDGSAGGGKAGGASPRGCARSMGVQTPLTAFFS